MNILLAGGAGYIGSHTCIELISAGHTVVIADNLCNSKKEAVKRVEKIVGQEIPFYEINVCDHDSLRKVFSENKIDAVIHFAGLKAVGESCEKPLMYYRNNLDSTLTLLEVMKEFGCHNFVFSSSATVYGIPETVPLVETMPTSCTNPYGWTKLMTEQILQDVTKTDPELSVVLLRYFNPIGAHESGTIGENPNGIPNNLMPYITQVAVGKLKELGVFGNDYPTPDGTGVRDYIHVVDLAKGHVKAIDYADAHKGTEIFNLGTGVGYSVLDIVKTFSKVNNVEIPYQIKPRRAGDIAECYADPTKAKEVLGWTAEKTLEDMCRDSWNWQKKNPKGYEE
ncbi:MAG: UDP-glucose 4-epimerase GalE [Ruminococcus sp.]|nr:MULTISPECIES: UDP-glucose 4-epimerase GalE [Ruminococcus]MCI5598040.1 UDP-glucose 4-epimerase GalE [Ruminococcus sp.]MCI5617381.1 UDP-glucose 4-epimerase GalE [Ruminococcus sp.]MCI6504780.1 UDP-glucose 4-epimerase GalE [Ruminococcus sp.]MDD5890061.1 UDP-glucose 4-epimerase GalE [Ruminococcus sp.]MDD6532095.1 UDP-glucose 4-epimerase GalE [Ruminococcus sp.]